MATSKLTKAYLRSVTNDKLQSLRAEYKRLADQATSPAHGARGPSRTWRNRIAMIMEEQGRRWGSV